jgi:hypothetical protein
MDKKNIVFYMQTKVSGFLVNYLIQLHSYVVLDNFSS